tara:strand:+ start:136 stop:306 length:171 start_codon:yes stop_codon:yes gene_type:complete
MNIKNKDTAHKVALDAISILNRISGVVPHLELDTSVNILLDRIKLVMVMEGYDNVE